MPQVFLYCTSTHVDVILLFTYAWYIVKMDKCGYLYFFVYFTMLSPTNTKTMH
jgi:hypothetical protein